MNRGVHATVLALIFAVLPAVACADIVQWTDTAGVTHYTNVKGDVPSHEVAQVVVDEQVWLSRSSALPDAEEQEVTEPEPPRYSEDEVLQAYLAGVDSASTPAPEVSTGGNVYISGPLAVAIAPSVPYGRDLLPGYGWLLPGYAPVLTTSAVWRHGVPKRGRFGPHARVRFPQRFMNPAGPPPLGAPGPPPFGAPGPPPWGAAGRLPISGLGSRFVR